MGVFDSNEEFARAVRRARPWKEPALTNRQAYAALIFGPPSSDTKGELLEKGELGKKGNNPEERKRIALTIIEKTGCPPSIFELSGLGPAEADRLRREFDQKIVEAKNEVRGEAAKALGTLEALLSSQGIDVPKER